jgi:hypothetical protein
VLCSAASCPLEKQMTASRIYSTTTIKTLFGQCGNQCAEPNCTNPIIASGTPDSDEAVVGQICHIYAASDKGPRSNPNMSEEERNAPGNLILLCGAHHPLVDKQYETYPASMLIAWKKEHEAKFSPQTAEAIRREAHIQRHSFLERMSDREIDQAVDRLRRARFLSGFAAKQEALILASNVESSELSGGSRQVRARALAWCARLLSAGDTLPRAVTLLAKSKELAHTPEATLAEAFVIASTDKTAALSFLASHKTPAALAAALRIWINSDGSKAAIEWTERAGLDENSFDADGKYGYLLVALLTERWDVLFRGAKTITEVDITENAGLLHVLAMARMLSAVPSELRASAAAQVPFEAREFRLASEPTDIVARREARMLFARLADYAQSVGQSQAANAAADYSLWLELRPSRSSGWARASAQQYARSHKVTSPAQLRPEIWSEPRSASNRKTDRPKRRTFGDWER